MSVYRMVIAHMGNEPAAQDMLTLAKLADYWRRNFNDMRERSDANFEKLCCRASELRRAKKDISVLADLNESYQAVIDDIDAAISKTAFGAFVIASLIGIAGWALILSSRAF